MNPWTALGVVAGLIALALVIGAAVPVFGVPPPWLSTLTFVVLALALVVWAAVYGWRGWPPPA